MHKNRQIKSISILVLLSFLITNSAYPQIQEFNKPTQKSNLRPQAFLENGAELPNRGGSTAEGFVGNRLRKEIRSWLGERLGLTREEVDRLARGIIWFDFHADPTKASPLKMRRSFIRFLAEEFYHISIGTLLRRGLIHERIHNILHMMVSLSDLEALQKRIDRIDAEFKKKFVDEYGEFGEEVLETGAPGVDYVYMEEVIAKYYSEKIECMKDKRPMPPLFSDEIGSAIEAALAGRELPRGLIAVLPRPMRERPPQNLHELFDMTSLGVTYAVNPLVRKRGEVAGDAVREIKDPEVLKYLQLQKIVMAAGIPTKIDDMKDMEEVIERARQALAASHEEDITSHLFLKDREGRPLKVAALPEGYQGKSLTLDDIARLCGKVDFVHLCAIDPAVDLKANPDAIISYTIAPGSEIANLLSRGLTVDGSSLDVKALKHIFRTLPTIGESDYRLTLDVAGFCLLQQRPDSPYKEAYIPVHLVKTLETTRRVDYRPPQRDVETPTTVDKVEELIKQNKITSLTILYSDFAGKSKEFSIEETTPERLIAVLKHISSKGILFSGQAADGFEGVPSLSALGALVIKPKLPTLRIVEFPGSKQAVMIGQFELQDDQTGQPWQRVPGHPRNLLKRLNGYITGSPEAQRFVIAPEMEFYLKRPGAPPTREVGYHRNFNGSPYERVIKDMTRALESIGERVQYVHAEVGTTPNAAQFEFVVGHGKAVEVASTKELHRWVLEKVARTHGFEIDFRAKPYKGRPGHLEEAKAGNGRHVHMSEEGIVEGERRNLCYNPKKPLSLSDRARQMIAGILKYAAEIVCLTNQTDNSYDRLKPGFEAPVYIAWGPENRSVLIRIPASVDPQGRDVRFEVRTPDSAGNPYLIDAALIAAASQGIEEALDLDDFPYIERGTNLYHMSATERAAKKIKALPSSLLEAWYNAYHSEFVKRFLPETLQGYIFDKFKDRCQEVKRSLSGAGVLFEKVTPEEIFISENMAGMGDDQTVKIGKGTVILGNGVYISGDKIHIGANVKINKGVRISTEGHLIESEGEKQLLSGTITIGDNVILDEHVEITARDDGEVSISEGFHIPARMKIEADEGVIITSEGNEIVYRNKRTHEVIKRVPVSVPEILPVELETVEVAV